MPVSERIMPLAGHFHELRKVMLVSGLVTLAASMAVYVLWADMLFLFLTRVVQNLEVPVIATRVTELFMAKIKISLLGGFVMAFPVILWQFWSFFAPALSKRERRWTYILIPVSIILFCLGITFTYLTVFPLTIKFLLFAVGGHYMPMLTVKEYLSFTLSFFIPMGLAFQLPLVVLVLGKMRIIEVEFLVQIRKYAILLIVILAAVLTGPDIVSQLMMAGPVYLLYEISVGVLKLSRFLAYRKERKAKPEVSEISCSN
jgi:sec-independent protein translocase protein TatC